MGDEIRWEAGLPWSVWTKTMRLHGQTGDYVQTAWHLYERCATREKAFELCRQMRIWDSGRALYQVCRVDEDGLWVAIDEGEGQ